MDKESLRKFAAASWLAALMMAWPVIGSAQVPVDDSGNPIAETTDDIPLLSAAELADLVGPIALYPDDLLAIVLPASTYPLQLVQADRFLQDLKKDATLKPDDDWDDSVVALTNYPEVVELLTDELDKTWRLGEAVVAQQADVIAAVEAFRDRAYAAGNLQSDKHQTVAQNKGVIEITPVEDDVIYVPYYEPERVVVYQSRPAYYYYPRPYPVYYYPYPNGYAFHNGFFWGVTTAFTVGWYTDSLHVYHHSYYGHPYYGHSYWRHRHWYRHPDIHAHNNYYYGGHSGNYHRRGDNWRPHSRSTVSASNHRVTRNRQYPGNGSRPATAQPTTIHRSDNRSDNRSENRSEVRFRERDMIKPTQARPTPDRRSNTARTSKTVTTTPDIKFRERTGTTTKQSASARPMPSTRDASRQIRTSRSDQPTRSSQPSRQSQVSRQSQASHSSQPSRQIQASRQSQASYSSQPSRQSQAKRSGSDNAKSHSSGSSKVASSDRGKSDRSARNRH